jgi:hypothetical protein
MGFQGSYGGSTALLDGLSYRLRRASKLSVRKDSKLLDSTLEGNFKVKLNLAYSF